MMIRLRIGCWAALVALAMTVTESAGQSDMLGTTPAAVAPAHAAIVIDASALSRLGARRLLWETIEALPPGTTLWLNVDRAPFTDGWAVLDEAGRGKLHDLLIQVDGPPPRCRVLPIGGSLRRVARMEPPADGVSLLLVGGIHASDLDAVHALYSSGPRVRILATSRSSEEALGALRRLAVDSGGSFSSLSPTELAFHASRPAPLRSQLDGSYRVPIGLAVDLGGLQMRVQEPEWRNPRGGSLSEFAPVKVTFDRAGKVASAKIVLDGGGPVPYAEELLNAAYLWSARGEAIERASEGQLPERVIRLVRSRSVVTSTFFGVQVEGNRIAYIVDVSGSMAVAGKLAVLQRELVESIELLHDQADFLLVSYGNTTEAIEEPAKWIEADERGKRLARRAIARFSSSGGSQPSPAFRIALSMDPPPDAILFLTDGEFSESVASEVETMNAPHGVPIHTIGLVNRRSEALLRRIAQRSGGTYTFAPVQP